MDNSRLIFIYNADSGLFNTLTDIAHKTFSPQTYQCNLCALTYGLLQEKTEWKAFIASLDIKTEFLHRDEFENKYAVTTDALPAIYIYRNSALECAVTATELNSVSTIDALKKKVLTILADD